MGFPNFLPQELGMRPYELCQIGRTRVVMSKGVPKPGDGIRRRWGLRATELMVEAKISELPQLLRYI